MEDFYILTDEDQVTDKYQFYSDRLLQSRPELITIDTETKTVKDKTLLGLGIGVDRDTAFYFPCYEGTNPYIPWYLMQNPDITKCFHNALFDIEACNYAATGVGLGCVDTTNIVDTAVMARSIGYPYVQLEYLSSYTDHRTTALGTIMEERHITKPEQLPVEVLALHCLEDCLATLAVYNFLQPQIDTSYCSVEFQVIDILINMSRRGMRLDKDLCKQLYEKYYRDQQFLSDLCKGSDIEKPGSPQQVGYILAKRGNFLPFNKRIPGRPRSLNTSEAVLETLDDPLASLILQYRHVAKLVGTYLRPLLGEDRVYPSFNLDAITGRISCRKEGRSVPLQGMPSREDTGSEVRNIILPSNGCLTDFDDSQVELRVLAYLSDDPDMRIIYEQDLDIHRETADFMQIDRKIAKNVNFSMIYGATWQTLQETAKIKNPQLCQQLIHDWFLKFRRAGEYIVQTQEAGLADGYIHTLFGRKIALPTLEDSEDGLRRKAINYNIQASAAEIIKRQMLLCKDLPTVLQVHDELLFDGDVEADLPVEQLENVSPLHTPITVKRLERWE